MVDYSTLTELELYRDAQTGEFIARDPDTSTEYAVPFEELNAGTATADTANIGSANIDSLGQSVNANGNDISNVGAFDSNSVNTTRIDADEVSTKIYLSGSQTISDGSDQIVEFDSVEHDNLNSSDISNNALVAPEGGKYDIDFYARALISTTFENRLRVRIIINGSRITEEENIVSDAWSRSPLRASASGVPLVQGDVVQVKILNTGPSAGNFSLDGEEHTRHSLEMVKVG